MSEIEETEIQKVDRRTREYRESQKPAQDAGRTGGAAAVRPATRYDTAAELARAEAFAREIRENDNGVEDDLGTVFNIPPEWIPPGFTYEGKRVETAGKRDENNVRLNFQKGWRPVPASRHPELTPLGFGGDTIIKNGLMLCERPTVLVTEARRKERAEARGVLETKKEALGMGVGVAARDDANVRAAAKTSYHAPVDIPAA